MDRCRGVRVVPGEDVRGHDRRADLVFHRVDEVHGVPGVDQVLGDLVRGAVGTGRDADHGDRLRVTHQFDRAVHGRLPRRFDVDRSSHPGEAPVLGVVLVSRVEVVLVILDGWGCAPPGPGNAVSLARTPVFDDLWARFPHTTLAAAGEAVGLPPGQMGNSEVGHLTIGAGRRLYQDYQRVNAAIADGSILVNPVLRAAFDRAARVHLVGLVSTGGVHSHIDHLRALLTIDPEKTWVHAFTDGRDAVDPPRVFVSGCFDMLHSGHVAFLEEAATYGALTVGIGSDATIAALKGRLCGMAEFDALNGDQQEQITRPFNEFNAAIERQKLIAQNVANSETPVYKPQDLKPYSFDAQVRSVHEEIGDVALSAFARCRPTEIAVREVVASRKVRRRLQNAIEVDVSVCSYRSSAKLSISLNAS